MLGPPSDGGSDVPYTSLPRLNVVDAIKDPLRSLGPVLRAIPGWEKVCLAEVRLSQISGAMTNVVFRASAADVCENKAVIVRLFGPGNQLFSQRAERGIFLAASDREIGPKCLLEFPGGRVEEFLPGMPLDARLMRAPAVAAAIARAMAHFHVAMLDSVVEQGGPRGGPAASAPASLSSLSRRSSLGGLDRVHSSGQLHTSSSATALLGSSPVQMLGSSSFLSRLARGGVPAAALPPGAGAREPAIYARIARWHATARELCPRALLKQLRLGGVAGEVRALRARTALRYPLWLGFCHNDLQYGNMLLSDGGASPPDSPRAPGGPGVPGGAAGSPLSTAYLGESEDAEAAAAAMDGAPVAPSSSPPRAGAEPSFRAPSPGSAPSWPTIHLIDYEYATLNDVAFDIANHFCEYAADYHSGAAHELDFGVLPSPDQELAFCTAYVGALVEGIPGEDPRHPSPLADAAAAAVANAGSLDGAAEVLLAKVRDAMPLAHLTWGLWGLIQHRMSDVDFDYFSYAQQRLAQYHATKLAPLADCDDLEVSDEEGEEEEETIMEE